MWARTWSCAGWIVKENPEIFIHEEDEESLFHVAFPYVLFCP